MPIRYEQYDSKRRVVLTVQGNLEFDDLAQAADRQAAANAWNYGVLLDARAWGNESFTATMVRAFVDHTAGLISRYGVPGPFVLVPRDLAGYGMGRMFQILSEATAARPVAVMHSIDDAVAWLEDW
jgi:hypothetical protein